MIKKTSNTQTLSIWLQPDLLKALRERHGVALSEVVRTLLLDHMTKPEVPTVQQAPATKFNLLCKMIQEHPNYSVARLMREAKASRGYVNRALRHTTGVRRRNPKVKSVEAKSVETMVADVPVVSVYQRFKNLFKSV